jgi:serine phosphatase RsbU (regulator of sigma subunit)
MQLSPEDHKEIRKVAYSDQFSTIERYRKGDVTILTMSGRFTPKLKSNALTMVRALRGDVALEIKDVAPIDLSFASFLRTLQQQVQSNNDAFILLRPPSRIVDMLNMCYGPGEFSIMTDETQVGRKSKKAAAVPQPGVRPTKDGLSADVRRRVSSLRREVIKTEEREKSLEIARARLIKMLPQVVPKIPRVEIGSVYRPSDKVGGDVYDFVNLEHGRHGIFLGDVSGHGIEAAVVVGMVKKVLDIYSKILITPRRVLAQSNKEIYPDLDANTFITAIYGVLEESTMKFTYGRAGHPHPILFNETRSPKPEVLASKGMSIGLDGGKLFDRMMEESTVQLVPGDIFVIYTDGVTEAADPHGEEFGVPRLLEAVKMNARLPAQGIVTNIYRDATAFSQTDEQQDDITIICIKAL